MLPSLEKGWALPAVKMTGGAEIPPREPVKVCTLVPEAGVLLATTGAEDAGARAPDGVAEHADAAKATLEMVTSILGAVVFDIIGVVALRAVTVLLEAATVLLDIPLAPDISFLPDISS